MAELERYVPEVLREDVPAFVRGIPGWLTPSEWRYVGAATLGAAGIVIWALALRRALGLGEIQPGDDCPREIYEQVLGSHRVPARKIERAWWYMPYVRAYAAHFGVDPTLLAGLIHTESGWNPTAGSHAGAVGLTQFMPGTAIGIFRQLVDEGQWPFPQLSVNNDPQAAGRFRKAGVEAWLDRTDPQQAVWLGAKLLRNLVGKWGNVDMALAAYNAGGARVKGRPRSEWPQETQRYVPGVVRRQSWYQELNAACGRRA